ncbi:SDR family NAD(P)-dependent oxidoreductase [Paraburkholderia sp. BL10I2N1]|uniref:SDR family NAD(P)-dependent oxidoreductase n=1 Tax=Paraburkholderia sp. BL10I2N1 TaxID=1938796 RepID=UPI00105E5AD7|nr:SDR family NAD(P)-dependent oxidoreductase [Paraburkholderia sp. BL10I2N1]TDN58017.1 NADP-dependent 3-hydroxy acid dehydrogenase YdfG [Paraburkholderia sp. BL10I2N1]
MKQLKDKISVITGAASGFGRELAICCAREGMHLVLTDVDEKGLQDTVGLLPQSTQTLALKCDVAKAEQVEQVAIKTFERFGAAHLLFNNAGVVLAGPLWATTLQDWEWVFGINVMGVAHGIRSFVPHMLEQKSPCHIVNTASRAGLVPVPGGGIYCASKHAVVAMSECLQLELEAAGAQIGVSVLCPGFVNTGIAEAARNRPAELAATNPLGARFLSTGHDERIRDARFSAADIAQMTLEAVKAGRFYILPHPETREQIENRMRDILDDRNPRAGS